MNISKSLSEFVISSWLSKIHWTNIAKLLILLEVLEANKRPFTLSCWVKHHTTFGKLVTALRGFDMRKEEDEQMIQPTLDPNVTFIAQKTHGRGCGNSLRGRGNQRGRENRGGFSQRHFNTQSPGPINRMRIQKIILTRFV